MIAYKGFKIGLQCLGYQFVMGLNVTEKANCRQNGFHCAENPLDCLCYYSNLDRSEYYIVNAGGDIDEDGDDSKIACTEITIIKKLSLKELLLHSLAYMVDHPFRPWNRYVEKDMARADNGFVVVRGKNPMALGKTGDILAFAKEDQNTGKIIQMAITQVDDREIQSDTWYDVDLKERKAS